MFVLKNDIVMFNKFSNMVSKNSEPVKSACEKLKGETGTWGMIGLRGNSVMAALACVGVLIHRVGNGTHSEQLST